MNTTPLTTAHLGKRLLCYNNALISDSPCEIDVLEFSSSGIHVKLTYNLSGATQWSKVSDIDVLEELIRPTAPSINEAVTPLS